MESSVKRLQKLIKPLPEQLLNTLPDAEKANFKNYKLFPIEILISASWNYKENDEYMAEKLLNNIKINGQIVTCQVRLLDSGYYEVVDGNHRHKAFLILGQSYVMAYDHGNITVQQAKRLAIETNETQFKANEEKLSIILNDLKLEFPDLELTLPFTEKEFNNLIEISNPILSDEVATIEEDNYDTPPPERPKTKRGDLYELNHHRLLCGDSTNSDDVKKLMNGKLAHLLFTDPPYNINYAEFNLKRGENGKNWTEEYCSEWEDSMSDEDYQQFLIDFIKNAKKHLIEYGHYYIWHATTYFRELLKAMEVNNIPYDKVPIQWVKQVAPLSWARYKRKNEPCLFGGKGAINGNGKEARWYGPNNEVTIWDIPRDHNVNYVHPTQKPIALAARAISNSTQVNENVLDMFMGSGTTLIATDMLKRVSFGMEYEPKFCDVIVKRFMRYCQDNDIDYTIKLNGDEIDLSYFDSEVS